MSINFVEEANQLQEELIARRRDLHQNPELGFEEVRTSAMVATELARLGMEVQTGIGKTGVIGILEGDQEGPTVLIRADMDALPIQEENDTDYRSQVDGKMHACGHDGHTTIALGVAKLLAAHRDRIAGRVKFVFQPAEELGQGARAMVKDGALESPRPDISLGLHLWNTAPLGQIGIASGPVMAAASDFKITLKGKGGHAALPNLCIDPIVCGAQLVSALQTISSRNVSPLDTVVVSVTQFHAGTATNIIPEIATIGGTYRTFTTEVRDFTASKIRSIANSIAEAMGCQCEVVLTDYTRPVINDPEVSNRVRTVFEDMMPSVTFLDNERTMGAEDVSEFMTDIPGLYFFLGSANAERGLDYGHHHPKFDFDEAALPMGVALLSAAIADYVIQD